MSIIDQNNFDENYYENISFNKNCWSNTIKPSNITYIFTKQYIGENNQLGRQSLEDLISTLPELEIIPKTIIFWCDSVELCSNGSKLTKSLKKLEKLGTRILVSSQALLALNLQNSLQIGRIANNLDFIHAINSSQKTVTF